MCKNMECVPTLRLCGWKKFKLKNLNIKLEKELGLCYCIHIKLNLGGKYVKKK